MIEAPLTPAPTAPLAVAPDPDAGAPEPASKLPHDMPFAAGQTWHGTYTCAQGLTEMWLRVVKTEHYRVELVFEFSHAASGAQGSYEMRGDVDPQAQALRLEAGAWRVQPPGYVTVDLDGKLTRTGYFRGRVLGPSCESFAVKKE